MLSLFRKDDALSDFATALQAIGFDLYATRGTAEALNRRGLRVTDVATIVGPPILGHRVVSLSREVHAGLLARYGNEAEQKELASLNVPKFDLLAVEFYPLKEALDDPRVTLTSALEMTDIGGPAMVMAAVKGQRIVLVDRNDWWRTLAWIKDGGLHRQEAMVPLYTKAVRSVRKYYQQLEDYLDSNNVEVA